MLTNVDQTVLSLGERELIEQYIRPLTRTAGQATLGDDCQLLNIDSDETLAITTDRIPTDLRALKWGVMSLEEYGYYSVATNLSDLAAVGARPVGYLLNLGLPPAMRITEFSELLTGVKRALELYEVGLSGGDTKEHSLLNIVGVAIGTVKHGRELLRRSAVPGQYLHYCGPGFGLAPAAFLEFGADHMSEAEGDREVLRSVLVNPVPQFKSASTLTPDCACIDNSDGIAGSLFELMRESGVGISLRICRRSVHPAAARVAARFRKDPLLLGLGSGGDFGLLFTHHDESIPGATQIGSIDCGVGIRLNGEALPKGVSGYQHLVR